MFCLPPKGTNADPGEWDSIASDYNSEHGQESAQEEIEAAAMERCVTLCRGRYRANMELLRRKKVSSLVKERRIIRFPRRYNRDRGC